MQHQSYLIEVNDTYRFAETDLQAEPLNYVTIAPGRFQLLKQGKAYIAELLAFEFSQKKAVFKINGNRFHVSIADPYDQLIVKMGLSAVVLHKISEIKAPMPGLVLSIAVQPGDEVVQGDPLLVLEAMKMENIIKSPGEGKVKTVHVHRGKPVDKGELLIEME